MSRAALVLLTSLMLVACGGEPELPPVEPLQADPTLVQGLPGATIGPHEVVVARDLQLPADGAQRPLDFNLYYPASGEAFPLLLFSHGNWSNKDSYDRLISHWVSHGYAVVAADHLDCCGAPRGIFNALRYGKVGMVQARVADLSHLLDSIDAIESIHPAFRGKSDPGSVALAGHSFGAFSAQQFGGAQVYDPDQERYLPSPELPVRAVVALSPPGPMFDTITADSWLELATPTLVTTGSWDIQPGFWDDWRLHLMSWETAQPGNKYALTTQGADHFLGNLICRLERDAPPQEDALQMALIATTSFLEAFLKADAESKAFIDSDRLEQLTDGFSRLRQR
jgi:predicted dienelactone hydrolase